MPVSAQGDACSPGSCLCGGTRLASCWGATASLPLQVPGGVNRNLRTAGTRKEVRVEGKAVLLFWYRNQIYAIEARYGWGRRSERA